VGGREDNDEDRLARQASK